VVGIAAVWLFFFAGPYAAGWWLGRGTLLASELRENVDELAHRQRQRAQRAVGEERARIARELHDVVAHNVTVMVVQTQAARRVAAADPAAAGTALQSVSGCGRDALIDMRRMIGVLHRGDLELTAPGLAQLPTLVEHAEAAGLRVSLAVSGTAPPLGASIDLAVYRLVQEALTNVIKHAGAARADITVAHSPGALTLDIRDDGRGPNDGAGSKDAGGHGLIGMRQRLALYGGEMHAGRLPDGGFHVHAWIPTFEDRQP
jgi:signal transduction histidine kinase